MAAVTHPPAPNGPLWTENGRHASGLNNDPRKLRGMLRRLGLKGWTDPAGVEANATSTSVRRKWSKSPVAVVLTRGSAKN